MSSEYYCPKCGKPISTPPLDAGDWIVYCPECGMAEALKMVHGESDTTKHTGKRV